MGLNCLSVSINSAVNVPQNFFKLHHETFEFIGIMSITDISSKREKLRQKTPETLETGAEILPILCSILFLTEYFVTF